MTEQIDLRHIPYMPLVIDRLRRSKAWLQCKRRPDLAFYMMNLWMHSWHEVPAGSIEADDDVLADAAMCSPERWDEIKGAVLRGWEKGEDGRLYHHVVVELADEAFGKMRSGRARTKKAREALDAKRNSDQSQNDDEPGEVIVTDAVTDTVTGSVTETVTGHEGKGREEKGREEEKGASADAAEAYAFVGRVIRLKPADYERWRDAYPRVNLRAELQAADDYYAENPPQHGRWFFAVSRWLKKANDQPVQRRNVPVEEMTHDEFMADLRRRREAMGCIL